jgi:hypothetical protein
VVDGVELKDTPRALLQQGKIAPQLKAVLFGSVAEDSGLALVHNASSVEFATAMNAEYLLGDYFNKTPSALAAMMRLYGNKSVDGPSPLVFPPGFPPLGLQLPPNSSANFNYTFTNWYWAAKHALADGEILCPSRWAAKYFRRYNVSAYQWQFRHPALQLTCKTEVCNAQGAPHSSDVRFWFSEREGGGSVQTMEELQLAHRMSGYLASTVTTGRPTASAEEWPQWDEAKQSILLLDVASSGGVRVAHHWREELCEWWSTVPDRYVPIT